MILIEKTEIMGFDHAIRGMRNPMNSWDKSDSVFFIGNLNTPYDITGRMRNPDPASQEFDGNAVGPNDHELMMKLVKGGPVHAKFRRMITVYVDITAPLYWWKEFDTYKVGTVANSCSTMHKIHEREFTLDDFSHEHLITNGSLSVVMDNGNKMTMSSETILKMACESLNVYRTLYLEEKDEELKKLFWWQMIQLLPSSYNQKRTIMLNYEVLAGIYKHRKNHKLDEWHEFCHWIELLPYSEIIVDKEEE